jgi:hypothetical protein
LRNKAAHTLNDLQSSDSVFVGKLGLLRALASFRGESARLSDNRTAWRQGLRGAGRAALNRADDRSFVHAVSVRHRGKALLAAHGVDHALLAAAEYGVWKDREIAEHPHEIYPLEK